MRDRELKDTPWEEFSSVPTGHSPVQASSQDAPVLSASYDDVVSIVDLVKSPPELQYVAIENQMPVDSK